MIMKMTIKELKERGEKEDKVKFPGKVKNVYDAKELTPEQKAKAKYTTSRQNVMVEDSTDIIKVIISHKTKDVEYGQDIVGKEIEVDGKISIWEGKKNIFGKLIFKEGEAPAQKETASRTTGGKIQPSAMPIIVEVRKASLRFALDFWTARIGDKMKEDKIIKTADSFYLYLTGKANIAEVKAKVQKIEEQEKEEKSEVEKEGEEIKKEEEISAAKVTLINEVMALKESQHMDGEVFLGYCDGEDIKTLTIEKLKEIKKKLNEQTENIPFQKGEKNDRFG